MKKKEDLLKLLKGWRRWTYIAGGLACIILGYMLASLWSQQRDNRVVALGVVLLWPLGAFLIYRSWHKQDDEVVIVGEDKPTVAVNCLNIYARKDTGTGKIYPVKVAFEWMNNPVGQPQQCINNGRWYFVNVFDIKAQRLIPLVLPDAQYFDPREFANVIKMPAHNNLFERRVTLFQKVAPWIMVAAFIIAIIGFIATTPVPPVGG